MTTDNGHNHSLVQDLCEDEQICELVRVRSRVPQRLDDTVKRRKRVRIDRYGLGAFNRKGRAGFTLGARAVGFPVVGRFFIRITRGSTQSSADTFTVFHFDSNRRWRADSKVEVNPVAPRTDFRRTKNDDHVARKPLESRLTRLRSTNTEHSIISGEV